MKIVEDIDHLGGVCGTQIRHARLVRGFVREDVEIRPPSDLCLLFGEDARAFAGALFTKTQFEQNPLEFRFWARKSAGGTCLHWQN